MRYYDAIVIYDRLQECCMRCKHLRVDRKCNAENCDIRDGEMDANHGE